MSVDDILKDTSLVAIIAGIFGLIIIFAGIISVVLIGLICIILGLINYLKNKNDIIALIAIVLGIIVIVCAIWVHYH
jgi:membrane-bound ClpP family serine protease